MSANRSVQAAQRRRMGQEMSSNNNRGPPQPSINSSQIFNGQRPTIKQQYQQPQQPQQSEGFNNEPNTKLTIAQAITLITLRLGSLETKMMNLDNLSSLGAVNVNENDRSFLDSITSRLESLEKRSITSVSQSTGGINSIIVNDVNMLKQQFDPIKNATIQCKNVVVNLTKENKELKIQIENLKQELCETKLIIENIQSSVIDLNNKFIMMPIINDNNSNMDFSNIDFGNLEYTANDLEYTDNENNDNEIIGTNLKELIEKEINFE